MPVVGVGPTWEKKICENTMGYGYTIIHNHFLDDCLSESMPIL